MIIAFYNIIVALSALYLILKGYCAIKLYRIHHRWGKFVAITFVTDAYLGLTAVITAGFGPRTPPVVLWPITFSISGRVVAAAGIAVTALFFLGVLNGVGDYVKPKDTEPENDRTIDRDSRT